MPINAWHRANECAFDEFLPELAKVLGRPRAEIRRTRVLATEYPYQWVRVYYDERKFPDSICDFGFAFFVPAPKKRAVAIFAQNAGVFVFNYRCVVAVRGDRQAKREKVVWGPEQWT